MKVNLIQHPGYPGVRIQMARKFTEMGGFKLFLQALKNPETPWLGAEALQIMLKTLIEVTSTLLQEMLYFICGNSECG
jgi:hypothetical protein